jgi:hypothetical protein
MPRIYHDFCFFIRTELGVYGDFLIEVCIHGRKLTGLPIRSASGVDGTGGVRRPHHHHRLQQRPRRRAGLPSHLRPAARQLRRAGRRRRRRGGAPTDQVRHRAPDSRPVRLAYQPPASRTFLLEQTSHQQPANSTFISEKISTSHQSPAKRTSCRSCA